MKTEINKMRQIIKSCEPEEFVIWKEQNREKIQNLLESDSSSESIWQDHFDSSPPPAEYREEGKIYYSKKELREALVNEQKYICCYCTRRITTDPIRTVIEHFYPKSIRNKFSGNVSRKGYSCLLKDHKNVTSPKRIKALLLDDDSAPFIIGYEDVLSEAKLVSDYKNQVVYLEF